MGPDILFLPVPCTFPGESIWLPVSLPETGAGAGPEWDWQAASHLPLEVLHLPVSLIHLTPSMSLGGTSSGRHSQEGSVYSLLVHAPGAMLLTCGLPSTPWPGWVGVDQSVSSWCTHPRRRLTSPACCGSGGCGPCPVASSCGLAGLQGCTDSWLQRPCLGFTWPFRQELPFS